VSELIGAVATAVPLRDAVDSAVFGGKAAALAVALRAGLPVPAGLALPAGLVAAVVDGDLTARQAVAAAVADLPGPLAVRSSAIGEDGACSSFAGQHLTELNVIGVEAALAAVVAVGCSAESDSAAAYRARVGAGAAAGCGVVVQTLVPADVAGVMFTRNPLTGADERGIEASWALGEAVVGGLVTPDCYRLGRDGTVLDTYVGHKDAAVVALPGGGTETRAVDAATATAPCLDATRLAALNALAALCDEVYGTDPAHDIEWAFAGGELALLQRRPVTA
jgi:pyruvate,water dikinase